MRVTFRVHLINTTLWKRKYIYNYINFTWVSFYGWKKFNQNGIFNGFSKDFT